MLPEVLQQIDREGEGMLPAVRRQRDRRSRMLPAVLQQRVATSSAAAERQQR